MMTRPPTRAGGSGLLLQAALRYASRGWRVLPIETRGKAPLGFLVPHGFQDATTEPDTIRRWWGRAPKANVGIRTGCESALVALDIDPRHDGDRQLLELERRYGQLPKTLESLTGGGGRHFIFAHPGQAIMVRNAASLGGFGGVDVRGDLGYIVAPPSIHASGHPYKWREGYGPKDIFPAPLPTWILDMSTGSPPSGEAPDSQNAGGGHIPKGQRNSTLTSIAGTMRARGFTEEIMRGELLVMNSSRCVPPLSPEDVARIAHSVARYPPGTPADGSPSVQELLRLVGFEHLGENPDVTKTETVLTALRSALRGADSLRRTLAREGAVKALKAAGIQSPGKLVDAALKEGAATSGSGMQGAPLVLAEPEPWHESVDGGVLLEEMHEVFERYLVLPEGGAAVLALWSLFTHAHDAAVISPILAIRSPEKRCGKTRTLQLLSAIVRRPLSTSNVSPAAVFRSVEKYSPTLLIDEADSFLRENEELRGLLNSGHTRGAATVIRTVGEDFEPRCFTTWAPKAVALIGSLPATLEDRSIVISMRRKAKHERVERFRIDRIGDLEPLRRKAARWSNDHLEALRAADPPIPEQWNDRAQDNWRPLLGIADRCGGSWPEEARRVALALSGVADEGENSRRVELLGDIREIFAVKGQYRLTTDALISALCEREDRPWSEWRRGKPMSPHQLSQFLRPFGIRPKQLWVEGRNFRGYQAGDFEDAFSRYLPGETLGALGTRKTSEMGATPEVLKGSLPSARELAVSDSRETRLAALAPPEPVLAENEETASNMGGGGPGRDEPPRDGDGQRENALEAMEGSEGD